VRESHFSSEIQSVGSGEQFTSKAEMWFKVKWSTVDMNTAVVPSLSCDPGKLEKYVKFTTSPSFLTSSNQTKLTDLPDDVLLMLFQMLPPKDLICLESSCSRMRRVIVLYNAYKLRLDKIFRPGHSTFLFFKTRQQILNLTLTHLCPPHITQL